MSILSEKFARVQPSQTKAMTQLASELRAKGKSIITLSQGEPDFETPPPVRDAAIAAIHGGKTKYTPVAGVIPLREAIVRKFERENRLSFDVNQVTVGCGAKQLLFNAFMATLDPGDEVVFPTPCWVSYPEMVKLAGGSPVPVQTRREDGYILQPEALRLAITPRTKWVLLNSPTNPTGAVYSAADLEALADVVRESQVWVLSDDIYEHLVYGWNTFATLAAVAPDLVNRILTVNGVSKAYAMTGWRLGYAAGPQDLISAMNTVQGQSASHTSSISQYAAIAALDDSFAYVEEFREKFRSRRNNVLGFLGEIPGLQCNQPNGAFYVFVCCQELRGAKAKNGKQLKTDVDFSMYLLEEAGVAVVPGSGFLGDGAIRISYAASDEALEEACARIKNAVSNLI